MEGPVRVKGFGTPHLNSVCQGALNRVTRVYKEHYAPIRGSPSEAEALQRLVCVLENTPHFASLKSVGPPPTGPPQWAATPWFCTGPEEGRLIVLLPYALSLGQLERPLALLTRKGVNLVDIAIELTHLEGKLHNPMADCGRMHPSQTWRPMAS